MAAEKISTGVRLEKEYIEELDKIAEATGKSRSRLMAEAIEDFLGKKSTEDLEINLKEIKERLFRLEQAVAEIRKSRTEEGT
ncbi:MAG: ribbon-helix-helix protein, CopG family [Symploca sp. SIO3C6]|nr:ribbon-helix-helix protein, CopG family [Symploca sp. SIO3C6]NET08616.1 ribbon-helix-helix protein, CopG family [Symploca sp. SIO2B6]NET47456.1 ribbon-helix-helix protein, CopG family [Merismopedia sp. SIO2A8]